MNNYQIKKVSFIKKETYKKVEDIWDKLSPQAKDVINSIFIDAQNYQDKAIYKAYENDKNFEINLKTKITKSKKTALEQIENADNEEYDLENQLNNI